MSHSGVPHEMRPMSGTLVGSWKFLRDPVHFMVTPARDRTGMRSLLRNREHPTVLSVPAPGVFHTNRGNFFESARIVAWNRSLAS